MNTYDVSRKFKLAQVLSALLMAGLACTLFSSSEVTPVPPSPTTAAPQPTLTPAPASDGEQPQNPPASTGGLNGSQRQHLASATVLIYMTDIEDGQYYPFGIGSGTILSADGFILTNSHVAKPSALGAGPDPDVLIIALNESESSPPVPTYIAEVQAFDGFLDIAVIRITSTMDGARIDPGALNLPFVDLGNSDDMHLGDTINIFGFPGIGGDTITFTKGSVSGFSSQDPVGDRAWIKTDATIAGGNSGGLGANDFGQIIGIPTRGGSGTEADIADCRVVQDTNGNGGLDEGDTCIPIGGFINALRPINLAMPLIRSAQTGTAYESPYGGSGSTGVSGTGGEAFTFSGWSLYFDEDSGCGIDYAGSFPSGSDQLTATFGYSGMTDGQDFSVFWLIDGSVAVEDHFAWDFGAADDCFPFFVHNGGDPLPDGQYTILLFAGEPQVAEVSTTIGGGGGAAPPSGGAVTVEGYITDADTGNPISGAVIAILKPGVDIDAWLQSGSDSDIYAMATTDANGYFRFSETLQRGVEYPALAGASSQGYLTTTGFILLESDDPDLITLNIELNK